MLVAMLIDKYTPFTLNALIGNRAQMELLGRFGTDAMSGKQPKPVIICGPPGTGKTTAARAVAYTSGFEVLELNSSDYRDSEAIKKRVLPATQTRGLFNKKILILFDEIDELSSKFDAGAEQAIINIIGKSKQPIIFTANDYWDRKIAFLRNYTEKVEFRKVGIDEIAAYLKVIMKKEGKNLSEELIGEIAKRSNGDVRSALNDLEIMFDAKPELIESLSLRDHKMEIFAVLDKIFLSGNFDIARYAVMNTEIDMGMLINWVDENIPVRYLSKKSRRDSYRYLSKASSFYENANRSNYYGYMRYSSVLLSSGVAVSNTGEVSRINNYSFPANIQYMSRVKKGKEAMNNIAMKLSAMLHSSRKDIIKGSLPLIHSMIKQAEKELDMQSISELMSRNFNLEQKDLEAISEYFLF
ncbi:MAG: replication factor C large subunit [Candidatus Micrarchaeaceae archaeon]